MSKRSSGRISQRKLKSIFTRTLLEILATNVFLSIIVAFIHTRGVVNVLAITLCLFAATAVFLFLYVRRLRKSFFKFSSWKWYLITNLSAYAAFAVLTVVLHLLLPTVVYTWLFCLTKFITYIFSVPRLVSIFVYHLLGFAAIFISPVGMKWVHTYHTIQ